MIAGGLGGSFGDLLMHPLDTLKTRLVGCVKAECVFLGRFD